MTHSPALRIWTITAAALAAGMAFIDTTALTVALPALRDDLLASDSALLWIHNAYAITLASLLLLSGSLGDHLGIRRIFLLGIVGFCLFSVACGLAPNAPVLIALRGLQGLFASLMIPGSLAMIARVTPGHSLGRAVGVWSMFTLVATALGPVLGGLLVQHGLWRGVFFINVPLAIAAYFLTLFRTPADPPPVTLRHAPDWPGAVLLALSLASISYALIERSPPFAAGALGFVLLFFREKSSPRPLFPPAIFRSRPLIAAILIMLLVYAAWAGFTYLLPTFLMEGLRCAPATAGLLQLPTIVCLAIVSPLAGKLFDRHGPRRPLATGISLCFLGFAMLAWPGQPGSPGAVLIPLVLLGLGLGFCAAPLSSLILASVPPEHHGLAAGINSTTARTASAFGVAVLGPLAYQNAQLDFSTLAAASAALCLLAAPFILLFTPRQKSV